MTESILDEPQEQAIDSSRYAGVAARIKAFVLDQIIMVGLMFLISSVFESLENVSDQARVLSFLVILLYDPILTGFTGATFGHRIMKIRVVKESNEQSTIGFFPALIRFIAKLLLGWISLLTVSSHAKRKAIHDGLSGSVVLDNSRK